MAYNDDLFCCYICIWVTFSSILIQFVMDFLPGKLPLNWHICAGKNPDLDENKDLKIIRNNVIIIFHFVLIFVYAFVNIRVAIFKRNNVTRSPLSMAVQNIKQKPFADYLVIASMIFVTSIDLSVVVKVQTIDMKESHIFPNYIYLYYQHLWLFLVFWIVYLFAYFIRNKLIRDSFFREVKSLLSRSWILN